MTSREDNSLLERVNRYASVARAVGGLAARAASQRYLGLDTGKGMPAELRTALGQLKGPVMKVAQILATIPDALPDDYAEELRQLQADAPSMGRLFVRRRMRAELGTGWRERFSAFDEVAASAASLGQVHRARHPDGRMLACKLQYPDMASIVEADLKQLQIAIAIYERYDTAIKASEIYKEICARLREELDYEREAAHVALYGGILAHVAEIRVPEVIPELSTGRLLCMSWLDGRPLLDFAAQGTDAALRNRIARNMFRAWYLPFYRYGLIHGDPHLGNYTIGENGSVNLLDFGCIRIFDAGFVKGVIDLYQALQAGNEDGAAEAYRNWGFENLDHATIEVLNLWARFLYAPLLQDRAYRIHETNNGVYGREVAAKVHAELRRLNGGVRLPREFVLMDRAAIGLGSVFLHLQAEVNWYREFHELVADFDPDLIAQRQAEACATAGVREAL